MKKKCSMHNLRPSQVLELPNQPAGQRVGNPEIMSNDAAYFGTMQNLPYLITYSYLDFQTMLEKILHLSH